MFCFNKLTDISYSELSNCLVVLTKCLSVVFQVLQYFSQYPLSLLLFLLLTYSEFIMSLFLTFTIISRPMSDSDLPLL